MYLIRNVATGVMASHLPVTAGVYTLVSRRSDNCIFRRSAFFIHSFLSQIILRGVLTIATLRKRKKQYNNTAIYVAIVEQR